MAAKPKRKEARAKRWTDRVEESKSSTKSSTGVKGEVGEDKGRRKDQRGTETGGNANVCFRVA